MHFPRLQSKFTRDMRKYPRASKTGWSSEQPGPVGNAPIHGWEAGGDV